MVLTSSVRGRFKGGAHDFSCVVLTLQGCGVSMPGVVATCGTRASARVVQQIECDARKCVPLCALAGMEYKLLMYTRF